MKVKFKMVTTITVTAIVTFSLTSIAYNFKDGHISSPHGTDNLSAKINTINSYLDKNYLYDDIDYDKAIDNALKGYVDSLNEPYTHYYSKEEFENYLEGTAESYTGIGVVISADTEADKIVVIAPFADSPAYNAGIKPGDYILAVDGTEFNASSMEDCVSFIKNGIIGTFVNIKIQRGDEVFDLKVERNEILSNSVKSEMLDNNIGYISISAFNMEGDNGDESTYTEFVSSVESLKKSGMNKLIIDLRDNPGGVLSVVCQIADYILPEGVITYTETRTGKREEFRSDSKELKIPIVVLINENSASASEVLTGALKDYKRATVVGETSYGKGIVQHVFPFYDGSGMSMTISKYYTPNGVSIHGVGIKPDYEISLPEEFEDSFISDIPAEKDTQLNKAIEILKTKE